MSKVIPIDTALPSTSTANQNTRIGMLVTMAAKIFGAISRRMDRRPSLPMSDESLESGRNGVPFASSAPVPASLYQQSSTRRLAFGSPYETDGASKPMNDFYNNSTLSTVSKIFCTIILLTAFFLVATSLDAVYLQVMSKSFNLNEEEGKERQMETEPNTSTHIFFL